MSFVSERLKEWLRVSAGTARNLLDAPVVVLLYHRVTSLAHDPQGLAVSPENFRSQLEWLKSRYPLLRFEDDWRSARRPAVVVTFDDGYADNMREALPIVEEVGVPVAFFVSTGSIGTRREFWWDEIERCLGSAPWTAGNLELPVGAETRIFASATPEDRGALYQALHPILKAMSVASRERALEALRAWANVPECGRESHRPLAVEELRTLAASSWATIGAHSVNHAPLARLPAEAQRDEIETSRSRLEAWIGRPVPLFSYPFGGRADYDRRTVALCRDAGFRKAAIIVPGSWHRWHSDLEIPRRLVRNWGLPEFAAQIGRMFRQ
jgi:peptidoglycan/xylan/chitin deacetylase (PgdA/CDA1 family)